MMLCAVIAKKNLKDVFDLAKKIGNLKCIDAIEFRFDYLKKDEFRKFNNKNFCKEIKRIDALKGKIKIGTCMLKQEGGNFDGSEDERFEILKNMLDFCDYLTIEIKTFQQHPEKTNAFLNLLNLNLSPNLILSYHNFNKCPSRKEIEKILTDIEKIKTQCKGNVIKKIAVKFNSFEDNYKILPFLTEKQNFRKVIMLGMGKYGKLSRVLNHYFGFLTYISVEEKTAEGQLNIREFEEVLKILE